MMIDSPRLIAPKATASRATSERRETSTLPPFEFSTCPFVDSDSPTQLSLTTNLRIESRGFLRSRTDCALQEPRHFPSPSPQSLDR